MQGKGIVKFFLVVMALVTLVQYFFFWPTNIVENNAEEYAITMANQAPTDLQDSVTKAARTAYLDSMSNETVFSIPLIKDFTYSELKGRQLALGLDLKGGMSVVLQVDLREFIRNLAANKDDDVLNKALDNAYAAQQNSQSDYVTLFADAYNELTDGNGQLSKLFATNPLFSEEGVDFQTPNAKMVSLMQEMANGTVKQTYKLLQQRIDEFGVAQPNVSLDEARNLIVVELPGIENPERARTLLQKTANLEFWDVHQFTDQGIADGLVAADNALKKSEVRDSNFVQFEYDTTYVADIDSLGNEIAGDSSMVIDTIDNLAQGAGPLFEKLQLNVTAQGQLAGQAAVFGYGDRRDRQAIMDLLNSPEARRNLPRDIAFVWSADPIVGQDGKMTDIHQLFAIKKSSNSATSRLSGERVIKARSYADPQTGEMAVTLDMDSEGGREWAKMTTEAFNDNKRAVAIVLDNQVVSAPSVNEPITGGSTRISGSFSVQEAQDLASILEIGKLPAKPEIIHEAFVGPSLGAENIRSSVIALVVGFMLVLLFMILYYGGGGIVSIIALLLNLFFIFGALASFGTVLTLPGIAGIVLTIGMAVDANVIIFERVREELRAGKSLLASVSDGFKHSYSAIIDANITTALVAVVLTYFGLGPIKGFAVVLLIGVFCSVFTAVLVGRLIIDWWIGRGNNLTFWTGFSKNAFANVNIDWLGKRKVAYVISGVLLVASLGSILTRGFDLGVDFKGGYSYNVEFEQGANIDAQTLRSTLGSTFGEEPTVKAVSTANTYNVVTSYLIEDTGKDAADRVQRKLFEGVSAAAGLNMEYAEFADSDSKTTHVISSSKVGPTIAEDIKESAFYAGILALLVIFGYLFFRFTRWQFSLGAVAALFHDSIIVLGIFSLLYGVLPFSLEVDQAFIAAILTVIGYSINDTVVVFDRIREYLGSYTGRTATDVINSAINSTISRTIITSLTTLFVVMVLFIFGGDSIRGFAFALIVGIVVGTYSSVFVATPIMADLSKGELQSRGRRNKEGTKSSFSKRASAVK